MNFQRYAIYVLPENGPLAEFGAAWLRWDARSGEVAAPPPLPDLPLPLDEITATPRKYGFHGTVKPPFQLAPGETEMALRDALRAFCTDASPVTLDTLELAQLGRFLALTPVGGVQKLVDLAAGTVRGLDRFRAPLSDAELARRGQSRLSPRQDALLQEWGYPYVMEEFRFHFTLTGKLPKARAAELRTLLRPILAPVLPTPFIIGSLSLMGEGTDGLFRQIERVPLSGIA